MVAFVSRLWSKIKSARCKFSYLDPILYFRTQNEIDPISNRDRLIIYHADCARARENCATRRHTGSAGRRARTYQDAPASACGSSALVAAHPCAIWPGSSCRCRANPASIDLIIRDSCSLAGHCSPAPPKCGRPAAEAAPRAAPSPTMAGVTSRSHITIGLVALTGNQVPPPPPRPATGPARHLCSRALTAVRCLWGAAAPQSARGVPADAEGRCRLARLR